VDGKTVTKASFAIDEDVPPAVSLQGRVLPYVSRGGLKLEAALDAFALDVTDLRAVDIGASTGGFTDCLLQRGAKRVIAVDAGEGQLAGKLLEDARVLSMERTNARELTREMIGGTSVDVIVMDVSFISATYILPRFPALLKEGGHAVCLIKPQFEVGRAMLGKGGIVKDAAAHRYAIERVLDAGRGVGLSAVGLIPSPIEGGDGNREFLVHFVNGECQQAVDSLTVERIVKKALL
jgi:23S rRNA (cytidine1920-2'-O)/16S rRNA (cytidine1409-2'-O)-methyltransferase